MLAEKSVERDVQMDSALMRRARGLLQSLHQTGKYPALQVCIRRHGKIVLHDAIGRYRPIDEDTWKPVAHDTRFMLFSLSKCITATCIHILIDRGVLQVDDLISWHIPEFGQRGKSQATIRHALTHQLGIPMILWNLHDDLILDWDRIVQTICEQTPWHVPGRRTGYHMISGGYVLGEIIRRVDGRDLRQFAREEILDPLGLKTMNFGIEERWFPQVASSERVDALPPRILLGFLSRVLDVDIEQALAVMNRPSVFRAIIPSGNVVGTAAEVSRFFELLLHGGQLEETRILSDRQVSRATIEQVMAPIDWTLLMMPQRYGLGFMLGRKSTPWNVFGGGTEKTFGHLGFMRNLGWADPDTGVAGALLTSGKPIRPGRELILFRRFQNLIRQACLTSKT